MVSFYQQWIHKLTTITQNGVDVWICGSAFQTPQFPFILGYTLRIMRTPFPKKAAVCDRLGSIVEKGIRMVPLLTN